MRLAHVGPRSIVAVTAAASVLGAVGLGAPALGSPTLAGAGRGAPAAGAAPAAAPGAAITISVTPSELTIGASATVSGRIAEGTVAVAGAPLALQRESYPFKGYGTVARTTSAPDGSFAFAALRLDRNTKVRVVLASAPASASRPAAVTVDPQVATHVRTLGPGRTLLSIRLRHTVHAGSAEGSVTWFIAARGTRVFRLAGVTPARELEPGLSYAGLVIDPPARRFAYRVCLNPRWEHAMGAHSSHGRCPTHDYEVPHDVR